MPKQQQISAGRVSISERCASKADQISLLNEMAAAASRCGADYLFEALTELSFPFESTVRSDFPGEFAVQSLRDSVEELKRERDSLRQEMAYIQQRKGELHHEASGLEQRVAAARRSFHELGIQARALASRF